MSEIQVGNIVKVKYGHGWEGEAKVVNLPRIGNRYTLVEMLEGPKKGHVGGFLSNDFDTVPAVPLAPANPVATLASLGQRVSAGSKNSVGVLARGIAIELGKQYKFVNSDAVQAELTKRGYTASQLGNAAGTLFRNSLFKRTGDTVLSSRPEANRRRISVWQYVGPTSAAVTPTPVQKFIVEVESTVSGHWYRSNNHTASSDFLGSYTFPTLAEAQAEAERQQKIMGPTYKYRAVQLQAR